MTYLPFSLNVRDKRRGEVGDNIKEDLIVLYVKSFNLSSIEDHLEFSVGIPFDRATTVNSRIIRAIVV
jgi:hypothetical protein